ncbi:hypothetical protein ACOME3_004835 [Neoechinorhynchus agilis]
MKIAGIGGKSAAIEIRMRDQFLLSYRNITPNTKQRTSAGILFGYTVILQLQNGRTSSPKSIPNCVVEFKNVTLNKGESELTQAWYLHNWAQWPSGARSERARYVAVSSPLVAGFHGGCEAAVRAGSGFEIAHWLHKRVDPVLSR